MNFDTLTSMRRVDVPQLALFGGSRTVHRPSPHEIWPPPADRSEIEEIGIQRNRDIGIAGRSGPIAQFEYRFLEFLDGKVKYAVTFNSGTSALLASYFALGVDTGVEVIGPALTYHAAMSPVMVLKGQPVLVDIRRDTRCIDAGQIEKRISERTKVITVVHQWGHAADMDPIMALADRYGLKVLEDCSHAHGSRYKGRLCGTIGHAAVFSLQTNKMIFAGEGGILVTNDQDLHDRATLFGHYRDRSRQEVIGEDARRFWVTGFGLKLRMSPFNAIVALHSLSAYPRRKEGRHACLNYFTEQLDAFPFIETDKPERHMDMGAWYGFKPLYLSEKLRGLSRATFIEALQAEGLEISVPSGPVLSTLPLYTVSRDPLFPSARQIVPQNPEDHPVAVDVERRSLSLPTFYRWPDDKVLIDAYIAAIKKVASQVDRLLEHEMKPQ